MLKFALAAGIAALMSSAALAGDNKAFVEQVQSSNYAAITQTGNGHDAGYDGRAVYQNGEGNKAVIDQVNGNNWVGIDFTRGVVSAGTATWLNPSMGRAEQIGNGNEVSISQDGHWNALNYNQNGDNNLITYVANGSTQSADLSQIGNGNIIDGSQVGSSGNMAIVKQGASGNASNGNVAGFSQNGSANTVRITQGN